MGEQAVAAEIPGEEEIILDAERARQRATRFERRAGADDDRAKIAEALAPTSSATARTK